MNTVIDKGQSKTRLDIIGKYRKKYHNCLPPDRGLAPQQLQDK